MRHFINVEIDVNTVHKEGREELLRDVFGTLMQGFGDHKINCHLVTIEREIVTEVAPKITFRNLK